jgi:hypothetical protein
LCIGARKSFESRRVSWIGDKNFLKECQEGFDRMRGVFFFVQVVVWMSQDHPHWTEAPLWWNKMPWTIISINQSTYIKRIDWHEVLWLSTIDYCYKFFPLMDLYQWKMLCKVS